MEAAKKKRSVGGWVCGKRVGGGGGRGREASIVSASRTSTT